MRAHVRFFMMRSYRLYAPGGSRLSKLIDQEEIGALCRCQGKEPPLGLINGTIPPLNLLNLFSRLFALGKPRSIFDAKSLLIITKSL